MATYKLTYFNTRGRGEVLRFIFAQAGVKYEDNRLGYGSSDWLKIKPSMPFGTMPVLEINGGKQLAESMVIGRYLAEEFGLAGANALENAEIAGVAESISDLTAIFVLTVFYEPDETRKAAAMKKLMQETVPGKLKYFEAKASTNESGWLCCSKMTWADLAAYQVLEWVVGANESAFDEFPSLKKLKASVEALPNIAKWLKERPQSPW